MSEKPYIILEAAVDSPQAALEAIQAGADRIELCVGLERGGLTPSLGLFQTTKALVDAPVFVLIRPSAGGFTYSDLELDSIYRDIRAFKDAGADGLVIGALTEMGTPHKEFLLRSREYAGDTSLTFHRAIDIADDPILAAEQIMQAGFQRILTSGQANTAAEGMAVIQELQDKFGNRIQILAGGGINSRNVTGILEATGVTEVHFSAIRDMKGQMSTKGPDLFPGGSAPFPGKVRRVRNAVKEWQGFRFLK